MCWTTPLYYLHEQQVSLHHNFYYGAQTAPVVTLTQKQKKYLIILRNFTIAE